MRLRSQFILMALLVVAALEGVLLVYTIPGWQAELNQGARARGRAVTRMLAHVCAEPAMVGNYSELQRIIDDLTADPELVFAAVLDRQGRVAVSSKVLDDRPYFPLEKVPPDPAGLLDRDAEGVVEAQTELYGKSVLDFAAPLRVYKRSWGTARLGLSTASMEKAASDVTRNVIWLGSAGLLVAMLLIVLLTTTITRPLGRLAKIAVRLSKRELTARADPSGAREMRQLGQAFNLMAQNIQEHIQDIQQKSSELEAGYRVLARLGTTMDRQALMEGVLTVIADVLTASHCELIALDPRQGLLDRFAWGPEGFAISNLAPAAFNKESFSEVSDLAALAKQHLDPEDSDLFVSLGVEEHTFGGLLARPAGAHKFSSGERKLAEGVSKHLLVALENARLYELAITDGLTGLTIRRYFMARLQEELDRSRRYGHPFSLLMLDIDHFKAVNDTHGHPAGDHVLRALARRLTDVLRSTDLCSRYGGEEMVVLLPGQSPELGQMVAEKICQEVANRPFSAGETKDLVVTLSAGVASYPDHGLTPDALIEMADRAMYAAKEAGRNCVRLAQI